MQTSDSSSGWNPGLLKASEDRLSTPKVLVVEDEREIRELLATVLDLEGFSAVTCDSAEAGLHALREQVFDLILTDYTLPHRTGLWLLEAGEAEGLIDAGTPVLIVTAHPTVPGARGYEIVQKPFDVDELVERVRRCMDSRQPRRQRPTPAPGSHTRGDHGGTGCPEPIELILYVSSKSPSSAAAVKSIKTMLSRFRTDRVKLTVRDLSADPASGVEDHVAFKTTLVRRARGPRTFIVGHINNPDLLLELLADCELEDQ